MYVCIYMYMCVYIYNEMLFNYKKGDPAICNVDGPGGHCAKWNKPDIESQILPDLTDIWNIYTNIP